MKAIFLPLYLGILLAVPRVSKGIRRSNEATKCIGGEKCDECAVGFVQESALSSDHPVLIRNIPHGQTPSCVECGECFTNWNRILTDLGNKTAEKVANAEMVKVTGVTGAYTRAFEDMESKLTEVKGILESASISNDELVGVQSEIDRINSALGDTKARLESLDNELANTKQSIFQDKSHLEFLRNEGDRLKDAARDMKERTTRLQEQNVEGALNLTREAKWKSDNAARKVFDTLGGDLSDSEIQRKATETLMENSGPQFRETQEQNQDRLAQITDRINGLESKIPDLNQRICDGETSIAERCDPLCGGAGCDKCGGLSCLNGALSKSTEAVATAEKSDKLLIDKDREGEQVLRDATKAHAKASNAAQAAQDAYDRANEAQNRSMGEMSRIDDLLASVDKFTNGDKARPEDIEQLHKECMTAEMSLDTAEIQDLAGKINEAIASVSNVDQIIRDTSEDISIATNLQSRADITRQNAAKQLEHAQSVTTSLANAVDDQSKADISIQQAQADIDSARVNLAQIENEMLNAVNSADRSVSDITDMAMQQQSLQTKFIENENHVTSAQREGGDAKNQASRANTELYQLNNGFKNVSVGLEVKLSTIGRSRDKAVELQRRANELATSASTKLSNLLDVEKEFEKNEERLTELNDELVRLNCEMMIHLQIIEDKSNFYRRCSPPGSWTPTTTCQCLPGLSEPKCTARRDVSGVSFNR